MKKYTLGFIGCGNMGGALLSAAAEFNPQIEILACDTDDAKAAAFASRFANVTAGNLQTAVENCEFIVLGVKPNLIPAVCLEIRSYLNGEFPVIVSMAAGVGTAMLSSELPGLSIIRIMPNTPVSIGCGVILRCSNAGGAAYCEKFNSLFAGAGKIIPLDEKLFDAGMALSGCGPAFAYIFAEALADGAVACGIPRPLANVLAAATVDGSAQMLLSGAGHPGELKDAVCSPGGTTIKGVLALEEKGFRSAAAGAVIAAFNACKK